MSESSLDDVLAFNDQLQRLSRADLLLDLGLAGVKSNSNSVSLSQAMDRVDAALRLRVELGQSLEEAIELAPELSPRYRASLKTWLRTGDPDATMGSITVPIQRQHRVSVGFNVSLIQPLVLVVLTFAAFLVLLLWTLPQIEAMYAQIWKRPSGVVVLLQQLRDWLPVWGVAMPLILVVAVVFWRSRSMSSTLSWLPGSSRDVNAMRYASYSDQVAVLLEREVPLQEALLLADPESANRVLSERSSAPLLTWALTGDLDGEPMPKVLRFVARTYRQSAAEHALIWRVLVPTVLGAAIGGLLVFAFGLSLFLPWIDLLTELSLPEEM